eukprot:SAG11_NODE_11498_length_756_cov_5.007610_1_plen_44_part_01
MVIETLRGQLGRAKAHRNVSAHSSVSLKPMWSRSLVGLAFQAIP